MVRIINFWTNSSDIYIVRDDNSMFHLWADEFIDLLLGPHEDKWKLIRLSSEDVDCGEEVEDMGSELDIFYDFVDIENVNKINKAEEKFDYFWNKFYEGE